MLLTVPMLLLALAADTLPGFAVDPDFVVELAAGQELANDIYAMTVDPNGRLVVSGRGYIRILVDDDGDGKRDRAVPFLDNIKDGAMGLWWEGSRLFFTSDGGLKVVEDLNGDDAPDGPPRLLKAMKTGTEHGAHAIRRGPDGWLYVLGGDAAGIDAKFSTTPRAPVADPIGGSLVRFSPDFSQSEVVADGFRNPYDFDFNAAGEIFTFDSDNERCVSLPWYEPTRFYHVVSSATHGWRNLRNGGLWRLPATNLDVTPALALLGRGSPTGVVCYRGQSYPAEYHDGLFAADWTFGKIYFIKPTPAGASYSATTRVFWSTVDGNGMSPTDLEIEPTTGSLLVSVGGRGTKGSVLRIRYVGANHSERQDPTIDPPLFAREWSSAMLEALSKRAVAEDLLIRRRAFEQILRFADQFNPDWIAHVVMNNWETSDRLLRQATARLYAKLADAKRREIWSKSKSDRARFTCMLGLVDVDPSIVGQAALTTLSKATASADQRDAIRLLQRSVAGQPAAGVVGLMFEGYAAAPPRFPFRMPWLPTVAASKDPIVRAELGRLYAHLAAPEPPALDWATTQLSACASPIDQFHWLAVLARLTAPRPAATTKAVAETLLTIGDRTEKQGLDRERNWSARLSEVTAELIKRDPRFNEQLIGDPRFGTGEHLVFVSAVGFDVGAGRRVFRERAQQPDAPWSPNFIALIGRPPEPKTLTLLRQKWEDPTLQRAIAEILIEVGADDDNDRLIPMIAGPDRKLGDKVFEQLRTRKVNEQEFIGAVLAALLQLGREPELEATRTKLMQELGRRTRQSFGDSRERWLAWGRSQHPDWAKRLAPADVIDHEAWSKRFAKIDWDKGDAGRGKELFRTTGCAACHVGGLSTGPDLAGAANRYSRSDLLTAIIDPNKDVPDRYRSTLVTTKDGEVYQGIIAYQATDGLILQTAPDKTIRIDGKQVASQRLVARSLMPVGLFDKLDDRQIADLHRYLQTLQK